MLECRLGGIFFSNLYRPLFFGSEVLPFVDELLDLVRVFIRCFKSPCQIPGQFVSGLLVSCSPGPDGIHDVRRDHMERVESVFTFLNPNLANGDLNIDNGPAAAVLRSS